MKSAFVSPKDVRNQNFNKQPQHQLQTGGVRGQIGESDKSKKNVVGEDFNPRIKTLKFSAEWIDVEFYDGHIIVQYGSDNYTISIKRSKRAYSLLRGYFVFRNFPRLIISVNGDNSVVLNPHVLDDCFSDFDDIEVELKKGENNFLHNRKMTLYLRKSKSLELQMRYIRNDCIKYLTEKCSLNNLIYDVPEKIIDNKGNIYFDESFLFPFIFGEMKYLIWESMEMTKSKSTYIFLVNDKNSNHVDCICSYISGDTPNKRLNLINSIDMRQKLGFYKRISHHSYIQWECEMASILSNLNTLHQ